MNSPCGDLADPCRAGRAKLGGHGLLSLVGCDSSAVELSPCLPEPSAGLDVPCQGWWSIWLSCIRLHCVR